MRFLKNKSSEKDIRDWLSSNGYPSVGIQFIELELHAIKRPGWLQVFRFELALTLEGQKTVLYGAMRSDERYGKPAIQVHRELGPRNVQLADWSEGLITHRRKNKR